MTQYSFHITETTEVVTQGRNFVKIAVSQDVVVVDYRPGAVRWAKRLLERQRNAIGMRRSVEWVGAKSWDRGYWFNGGETSYEHAQDDLWEAERELDHAIFKLQAYYQNVDVRAAKDGQMIIRSR